MAGISGIGIIKKDFFHYYGRAVENNWDYNDLKQAVSDDRYEEIVKISEPKERFRVKESDLVKGIRLSIINPETGDIIKEIKYRNGRN